MQQLGSFFARPAVRLVFTMAAALAVWLFAMPAARANTMVFAYPTNPQQGRISGPDSVYLGATLDPHNVNPNGISYDDCEKDLLMTFTVNITLSGNTGDSIVVYASTSASDCSQAMYYTGTTQICWPVTLPLAVPTNQTAPSVNVTIRARDIAKYVVAAPGQQPSGGLPGIYTKAGEEACHAQEATGNSQPPPVTLFFYFTNGQIDTSSTGVTYAGSSIGTTGSMNAFNVNTLGPPPPAPLSGTDAVGLGDGILYVNWTTPVSGNTSSIVDYRVFCSPNPGTPLDAGGDAGLPPIDAAIAACTQTVFDSGVAEAGAAPVRFAPIRDVPEAGPDAGPLVSIAVTPINPSVPSGGTQQFNATGTYTDGSMLDLTSSVTWATSDPNVATIDAAGLATSTGTGTANTCLVIAVLGTLSGSTTLTVPGGPADAAIPDTGALPDTGTVADSGVPSTCPNTISENANPNCTSDPRNPFKDGMIGGSIPAAYLCGSGGGATGGPAVLTKTIQGVVDFNQYFFAVAAVDNLNNVGPLINVGCGTPKPIQSFWDNYEAAGGQAGGGFCDVRAPGGEDAVGTTILGVLGFGVAGAVVRRASRRRRSS